MSTVPYPFKILRIQPCFPALEAAFQLIVSCNYINEYILSTSIHELKSIVQHNFKHIVSTVCKPDIIRKTVMESYDRKLRDMLWSACEPNIVRLQETEHDPEKCLFALLDQLGTDKFKRLYNRKVRVLSECTNCNFTSCEMVLRDRYTPHLKHGLNIGENISGGVLNTDTRCTRCDKSTMKIEYSLHETSPVIFTVFRQDPENKVDIPLHKTIAVSDSHAHYTYLLVGYIANVASGTVYSCRRVVTDRIAMYPDTAINKNTDVYIAAYCLRK